MDAAKQETTARASASKPPSTSPRKQEERNNTPLQDLMGFDPQGKPQKVFSENEIIIFSANGYLTREDLRDALIELKNIQSVTAENYMRTYSNRTLKLPRLLTTSMRVMDELFDKLQKTGATTILRYPTATPDSNSTKLNDEQKQILAILQAQYWQSFAALYNSASRAEVTLFLSKTEHKLLTKIMISKYPNMRTDRIKSLPRPAQKKKPLQSRPAIG